MESKEPAAESRAEPARARSARSLISLGRFSALGLSFLSFVAGAWGLSEAVANGFGFLGPAYELLSFIVCSVMFVRFGRIRDDLGAGRYQSAQSDLLVWAILGTLLGYAIGGILPLAAWVLLDPVVGAQRPTASPRASWRSPVPVPSGSSPASAPARPNEPLRDMSRRSPERTLPVPMAPACPHCDSPTLWIARHRRWYCVADRLYL